MNLKNVEQKFFSSFDGNFSTSSNFLKPKKYKDIELISRTKDNFINLGSNLSYSPLGFYEKSISLDLEAFNRILNFDQKKKEITVEAGITLAELLNFTLKYNLWIPQLPGYPFITLGGAVATNAHGKSCGIDGAIRNSVKNILIFHKKNGWLDLSREENREIFDLTIGGLGLTGTIVSITLNLQDITNSRFTTIKNTVGSLRECIKIIKEKSAKKIR